MRSTVVCISATDGSAAEAVASRVGGELGYPVINDEIVSRAAAEAGVSAEAMADVERRKTAMTKILARLIPSGAASDPAFKSSYDAQITAGLIGMALPLNSGPRRSDDELRGLIRSAIDEYMASGSVVLFAHAASHSLAGRDGVLRVLVTGSPEARSARLAEQLGVSPKEAQAMVKTGDANRADYLKRFYGIESESPSQYDLVVNTDELSVEEAARQIVSAAQSLTASV